MLRIIKNDSASRGLLGLFMGNALFLLVGTAHADTPHIEQLIGTPEEGESVTITGVGFTSKAHDKPLLVWRADDGELPNPELGRAEQWDAGDSFGGEIVTAIVAPGSSASGRFDHGRSSGKALGWVRFDTGQAYVFRKIYEDFDTSEDYAVRTRFNSLDGEVSVGQKVVGASSGATGYVGIYTPPGSSGRGAIQYEKHRGSIYDESPVDFEYGETMTTETGTMVNAEGSSTYPTGTFRTFNFKTMRFWHQGQGNNMFFGAGIPQNFIMTPERTGGTQWSDSWQNKKQQRPEVWQREEIVLDTGSIGTDDAILRIRTDGVLNLDTTFTSRDEERPESYYRIAQSQVSNGAQPESYMYYDMLYVDDSWHRVILCSAPEYVDCEDPEVQLVESWDGGQGGVDEIRFTLRRGSILSADTAYLYVVNGNDAVNPEGHPISLPGAAPPKAPTVTVETQ